MIIANFYYSNILLQIYYSHPHVTYSPPESRVQKNLWLWASQRGGCVHQSFLFFFPVIASSWAARTSRQRLHGDRTWHWHWLAGSASDSFMRLRTNRTLVFVLFLKRFRASHLNLKRIERRMQLKTFRRFHFGCINYMYKRVRELGTFKKQLGNQVRYTNNDEASARWDDAGRRWRRSPGTSRCEDRVRARWGGCCSPPRNRSRHGSRRARVRRAGCPSAIHGEGGRGRARWRGRQEIAGSPSDTLDRNGLLEGSAAGSLLLRGVTSSVTGRTWLLRPGSRARHVYAPASDGSACRGSSECTPSSFTTICSQAGKLNTTRHDIIGLVDRTECGTLGWTADAHCGWRPAWGARRRATTRSQASVVRSAWTRAAPSDPRSPPAPAAPGRNTGRDIFSSTLLPPWARRASGKLQRKRTQLKFLNTEWKSRVLTTYKYSKETSDLSFSSWCSVSGDTKFDSSISLTGTTARRPYTSRPPAFVAASVNQPMSAGRTAPRRSSARNRSGIASTAAGGAATCWGCMSDKRGLQTGTGRRTNGQAVAIPAHAQTSVTVHGPPRAQAPCPRRPLATRAATRRTPAACGRDPRLQLARARPKSRRSAATACELAGRARTRPLGTRAAQLARQSSAERREARAAGQRGSGGSSVTLCGCLGFGWVFEPGVVLLGGHGGFAPERTPRRPGFWPPVNLRQRLWTPGSGGTRRGRRPCCAGTAPPREGLLERAARRVADCTDGIGRPDTRHVERGHAARHEGGGSQASARSPARSCRAATWPASPRSLRLLERVCLSSA